MIHHQLHTTRPRRGRASSATARRAPGAWARPTSGSRASSPSWPIGAASEVVAMDRGEFTRLGDRSPSCRCRTSVDLVAHVDPLQGFARTTLYAAEGGRGIHVLDVRRPTAPRQRRPSSPRSTRAGSELAGDQPVRRRRRRRAEDLRRRHARVAAAGRAPARCSTPTTSSVRWPWAYVADGRGGAVRRRRPRPHARRAS